MSFLKQDEEITLREKILWLDPNRTLQKDLLIDLPVQNSRSVNTLLIIRLFK